MTDKLLSLTFVRIYVTYCNPSLVNFHLHFSGCTRYGKNIFFSVNNQSKNEKKNMDDLSGKFSQINYFQNFYSNQ